jgi:hypothetical protein
MKQLLLFVFLNEAIIHAVLGLLCCLIVGFLFAGRRVFVPMNPSFQFLVYGIAGALDFSILKFSTMRNFLFAAALLLILYVTWARIRHLDLLLWRLLQFAGIAAAIYVYHHFYESQLRKLRFGKFLALGGAVAAANFLLSLLLLIFVDMPEVGELVAGQTLFGFLIGSGLGIGFEIAEKLKTRLLQIGTA